MKKTLVALAVLVGGLFTVNQVSAQRAPGHEIQIGVSPMLPLGDFGDLTSFGIGADVQYAYNFDESIAATVSAGYNHFLVKSEYKDMFDDPGYVPVKAGVRYGIGQFYLHPQLGVTVATAEGAGAAFTYGIGAGANLGAKTDLSLRYEAMSKNSATTSFLGLRLGFRLK